MSDYETSVRTWAARRLELSLEKILKVEFDQSSSGCDTCGYGIGTTAVVTVDEPQRYITSIRPSTDGNFTYELAEHPTSTRHLDLYDIAEAIAEVIAISHEDA